MTANDQPPATPCDHPLFALANELRSSRLPGAIALYSLVADLIKRSDMLDYMQADWLAVAEHVTAMLAQARADERERMAGLGYDIYSSAQRWSTTAHDDVLIRQTCAAYAAAIRAVSDDVIVTDEPGS